MGLPVMFDGLGIAMVTHSQSTEGEVGSGVAKAHRAMHAVQEAQRMYSVAPLVVRKALQDVRIGQYTIPAGTAMILHVFAMHNTSANYERHAEFLPVSYTHFRILCLTCSQVQ